MNSANLDFLHVSIVTSVSVFTADGKVVKVMGRFVAFDDFSQALDLLWAYSPSSFPCQILLFAVPFVADPEIMQLG